MNVVDTPSGNTVAQYAYDGAKRRTVKLTYAARILSETRHFFYTDPEKWQVVEERVGTSTNAERQFVWGLRYIDELVLRDRDTTGSGTLNERLYGLQDPNWNIAAIVDSNGITRERYGFDPYGVVAFFDNVFASQMASTFDWETLYAGYRRNSETGTYSVRARMLHPKVGWLQRDPFGLLVGPGLYLYSQCNPLLYLDPTGSVSITCECVGIQAEGEQVITTTFSVTVKCKGIATTCCADACGTGNNGQFTGDWSMLHPPDPPRVYDSPGYGNYCGPRCGLPNKPIDCVDAACKKHDQCLATITDWLTWSTKRGCEKDLCNAVYACPCESSPNELACQYAREFVLLYSCASWWAQQLPEDLWRLFSDLGMNY